MPNARPPATSENQCAPRYRREKAIRETRVARPTRSGTRHATRTSRAMRKTRKPYMTAFTVAWPLGKEKVLQPEYRSSTGRGRLRETLIAVLKTEPSATAETQ